MKIFPSFAVLLVWVCVLTSTASLARVVDGNAIMDQPMRENLCALTFDDGPSPYTPQLLDVLAEYGIPATFFLLGRNALQYPDIVRRMLAEGHEVGNHTYTHPRLNRLGRLRQEQELQRTDAILRDLGAQPVLIRPPYGLYNATTKGIAERMGASLILWSLDSNDWRRLPDSYADLRSTRGTVYAPGTLRGIFLFQDTHETTVEDVPRIVRDLRLGGCQRFVTVSDYLEGLLDPEPCLLMPRNTADTLVPQQASRQSPNPDGGEHDLP